MRKLLLIILAAAIIVPHDAFGFGKNKVQYQRMDWQHLKSPHYTLYYHQDQGTLPAMSYMWLDGIYSDLSARFGFVHGKPVPVVLYESPALFEQTNIISELLPEEVGGFTEIFKNRVAVPFNGSYGDLRHVLHHEMVHAFVFGVMLDGGSIFRAASASIPLWFNEGLAEVLSSGWNREADMYMLDRVLHSNVPPPGPMMNGYIVYKGGQSFFYYLHSIGGDSLFNAMLLEFRKSKDAEKAIEKIYKAPLDSLGKEWQNELRRIYWPEIGKRVSPSSHARALTESAKDRSLRNVRPRVSPSGKLIAFFSDRKNYMRIIITDTSGNEIRQIGQHGIGPGESFESFQPMNGSIAWGPKSSEIAFAAKNAGRSEIRIVDLQKRRGGQTTRTIRLGLSAVTGLDWSRDGKTLAVTAVTGGQSELYTFDLETSRFVRLTNGPESKSSPRISPDGKKILFTITDTAGLGASSPLPHAAPKPPRSNIALYNIEMADYRLLTDNQWNDKQPTWSPDGRTFVFVSDRNGIDNLYMASIDDPGGARPLTDYTGGAGSPDWAADGSALVYDLFADQAWNVWRMEKPEDNVLKEAELVKTVWAEHEENPKTPFFMKHENSGRNIISFSSINKKQVDTLDRTVQEIDGGIVLVEPKDDMVFLGFGDSAVAGHVNGVVIDVREIDYYDERGYIIGDPAVFGDADSAVVAAARAKAAAAADSAAAAAQPADTPASTYALRPHKDFKPAEGIPDPSAYRLRFTPDLVIFGLGVSTYSGASGQALAQFSDIMGDHRITVVGDMQANITEYAQVFAAYQYLKLRFDLMGGGFYYKNYSYDGRFRQYYHDLETGVISGVSYPFSTFSRADMQVTASYMQRDPITDPNVPDIKTNALLGILGYTYDNILWGITGPLKGFRGRARLHFSPPAGFIEEQYLSADIDIRHYTHFLKRFVWANRITAGGSLSLNDNEPARRFLLGGSENWFNYDVNIDNYDQNISYSNYAAIVTPLRGWKYFETAGDRVMLMNSEFRFPFIKELSTVWPIPMQLRYVNGAIFMDGGYAWTSQEQSGDLPIPPRLMGGYGFGMRANLGIFVLRYDRGWPMGQGRGNPINYFSLGAEF